MREKKGFLFNVGIPSILMILLTFILAMFALLSMKASASEQRLAEKTGQSVQEYYEADQKAEYALCYIDAVLDTIELPYLEETLVGMEASKDTMLADLDGMSVKLVKNGAFSEGKARKIGTVSFFVPMTEKSRLQVAFAIYSDRSYRVTRWNTETDETKVNMYELEDGVELWDGVVDVEE